VKNKPPPAPTAEADAMIHRVVDETTKHGMQEDGSIRSRLKGMFPAHLELKTLEDALAPILVTSPYLSSSVKIAKKKAGKLQKLYPLLCEAERAAIVLYTMEEFPQETSVRLTRCGCFN
jgi:hypothetical protein